MDPVTVYIHPTCSKSRAALSLLDSRGTAYLAVDYLQTPPDAASLDRILDMLEGDPAQLVRTDDPRFAGLGLGPGDVADRQAVITVLVAHPDLMQRPVVVRDGRAVVARPPELLFDLFDGATVPD
ncbi:MAG TPA: ArsC/Spx/MgsR family protein [Acidimicrobiales bacterium]|nr:ArsC/Spx/MgsR family protein [Acidimicrobiales bacterium]